MLKPNTFIIYFKELPTNIKYSTYLYIGALFSYNAIYAYYDSKQKLLEYRNDGLYLREKNIIKNEWEAVKYGASQYFLERLFNSIIWPINIISYTIPFLVLTFNKSDKNKK